MCVGMASTARGQDHVGKSRAVEFNMSREKIDNRGSMLGLINSVLRGTIF